MEVWDITGALNINSNVFVKCAVGDAGLSVRF
jgi:hypothetical protein